MFASIPYLVVEYDDGQQKQCNFKYENQVDDLLNCQLSSHRYGCSVRPRSEAGKAEAEKELRSRPEITTQSQKEVAKLQRAIDYLDQKPQLSENLSRAAEDDGPISAQAQAIAGGNGNYYAGICSSGGRNLFIYCLQMILVYSFVWYRCFTLPVSVFCQRRNNRKAIMSQDEQARKQMEDYVKGYPIFRYLPDMLTRRY